jgi:DNA recombination protein RmuC
MTLAGSVLIVCGLTLIVALWLVRSVWSLTRRERVENLRDELRQSREDAARAGRELREELALTAKMSADTSLTTFGELTALQQAHASAISDRFERLRDGVQNHLTAVRDVFDRNAETLRSTMEARLLAVQGQNESASSELRREVLGSCQNQADSAIKAIGELGSLQKMTLDGIATQVKGLTDSLSSGLETVRAAVDTQLRELRESNTKKLDEMRQTVDEQLQGTLEKRLAESFSVVSGHLESVQRGLGEMQALATGVGDLKRVLTNVKARGTWGEVQIEAILEQILAPEQFDRNVQVRSDSGERVEFAVRLPGSDEDPTKFIWLPIDSKFPQEPYAKLIEASENGDAPAVQAAAAELGRAVRRCAADINAKYIAPPATTDFAVLFLPTEGLYSEVLRQPTLASELQLTYRVVVAGPTTLVAILSSLRIGFRTLAIKQRASEVWAVLGAVKTEFTKFGDVLTKLKKQLDSAARTVDESQVRARAMARRLRDVEELPVVAATDILQLPEITDSNIDALVAVDES